MTFASILITGASSGLGAALARHYAAPGIVLNLWGRNGERLTAVAKECRARGAEVAISVFDVTEYSNLVIALETLDEAHPLDLAIFNAGLGGSLAQDKIGQAPQHAEMMAGVNFTAPAIAANVVAERMAARKRGRIALIGSVAAAFPLPMAPIYSGSKAGLAMFAEALSLRLKGHNVAVTLVSPGFIDTPMSQSLNEPRPFLIGADKAAAIIARRLAKGDRHIVVPWQFSMILGLSKLIPRAVVRAILSKF